MMQSQPPQPVRHDKRSAFTTGGVFLILGAILIIVTIAGFWWIEDTTKGMDYSEAEGYGWFTILLLPMGAFGVIFMFIGGLVMSIGSQRAPLGAKRAPRGNDRSTKPNDGTGPLMPPGPSASNDTPR
jgi:hypothetical protein